MKEVTASLEVLCRRVYPRLLTQVCRDPGDDSCGSCDRNWWHYRIRDFSSIILQQTGYTLSLATNFDWATDHVDALNNLVKKSAQFWNKRACAHGAFEEYYPYEQGYPPLAFSTLAIARLLKDKKIQWDDVADGCRIAIKQLSSRFEDKALNQQVAGLAALGLLNHLHPKEVDSKIFDELCQRTLSYQTSEGWFPEYDGPDIGYLSVTVDCLWDLYDVYPQNIAILESIEKSLNFIAWYVNSPFKGAGMHNSRNTDYIVPFCIARGSLDEHVTEQTRDACKSMLYTLYSNADSSEHFFSAIDDRYWGHYIGHSLFRASQLLASTKFVDSSLPIGKTNRAQEKTSLREFPLCGHVMLDSGSSSVLISCKKGGVLSVIDSGGETLSDYGWIVSINNKQYVSHWWSNLWNVNVSDEQVTVSGQMVPHKSMTSTPLKHMVLRILSFTFGRKIISLLKNVLIFKKSSSGPKYTRCITLDNDNNLLIVDTVCNLPEPYTIVKAPRSSKRHVASADSYHWEDLCLSSNKSVQQKSVKSGNKIEIITKISL